MKRKVTDQMMNPSKNLRKLLYFTIFNEIS
jgi:hypothetical protein